MTPKIKAIIGSSSKVEENLWTKCPACERMIYTKELEDNYFVCGYCSHHFYVDPKLRFDLLFNDKKYEDIPIVKVKDDPLKFKDSKRYIDRLKESRNKTNKQDAVSIASGFVGEKEVVCLVMDFSFMGGSMGLSVGKSFVKAIEIAIEKNAGFVVFTSSGGARMQEGMLSLMQMPATIAALCNLKEKRLPFINVFTNPTTGGVLASFAMLGDIHIAEPNALIGFAGARVIEKTIKHKLPAGFQRSEFLKNHGMIDIVASRIELSRKIRDILSYTL